MDDIILTNIEELNLEFAKILIQWFCFILRHCLSDSASPFFILNVRLLFNMREFSHDFAQCS